MDYLGKSVPISRRNVLLDFYLQINQYNTKMYYIIRLSISVFKCSPDNFWSFQKIANQLLECKCETPLRMHLLIKYKKLTLYRIWKPDLLQSLQSKTKHLGNNNSCSKNKNLTIPKTIKE